MKSRKYQEKEVSEKRSKSRKRLSNEELLDLLKDKAQELGRSPRMADLKEDSDMRDPETYRKHFGSWNNALERAGLSVYQAKVKGTDEELLDLLKVKAEELSRTPRMADLSDDSRMPAVSTYVRRFCSWNNALKLAGLTPNIRGRKLKYRSRY